MPASPAARVHTCMQAGTNSRQADMHASTHAHLAEAPRAHGDKQTRPLCHCVANVVEGGVARMDDIPASQAAHPDNHLFANSREQDCNGACWRSRRTWASATFSTMAHCNSSVSSQALGSCFLPAKATLTALLASSPCWSQKSHSLHIVLGEKVSMVNTVQSPTSAVE